MTIESKIKEKYGRPANAGYVNPKEIKAPEESDAPVVKQERHNVRDARGKLIRKPKPDVESSGEY